jgi:hypothetical protein
MPEVKITCPNCFSDKHCFEETAMDFKSYMCFNCGFTSNSAYNNDSDALKKMEETSSELMREISMFDYDRKIHWFPTILNMGKFGMLFPEGTKSNWNWKLAEVRKLSPEEQKNPMYEGHEHTLDIENATTFGQHEFLEACKKMGIVKDIS